jgi:hypothetical protein
MKKRTAIVVSGALLCSVAGYFAWCLRPFYRPPDLYLDASLSADGRKAVEEWVQTSGYPPALKLTWSAAFWNLSHPWDRKTARSVLITEERGGGLWAADGAQLWSFSKVRGKWDSSTVKGVGGLQPGITSDLMHWGSVASRLEALDLGGAVIEVISLGPPTDSWMPPSQRKPQWINNSPDSFYEYTVLGRIRVLEDRERQELVEALARSIREGRNTMSGGLYVGLPASRVHAPPHAIVFTKGEVKHEFLIWFDLEGSLAFGEGVDAPYETDGDAGYSNFHVSPHAATVFDAFLDKHQIERAPSAKKP